MSRFKSIAVYIVILSLLVASLGVPAALLAQVAEADAYIHISDVAGLQAMNEGLSGVYILDNDIDASATSTWNGGAGFLPVGNSSNHFTGSFDGQRYTITGLYINRSSTDYVGLFGYIGAGSSCSVGNVTLMNVSVRGQSYVGALAGCSWHFVSVYNSSATGNVTGDNYIGGLVGHNYNSVSNSYATVSVSGYNYVGGLVGLNDGGTVSNSYSTGNVSGYNYPGNSAGGLVGYNNGGMVSNSYSTGSVSGSVTGGLVGINNAGGSAPNSFWDTDTSGQGSSAGGTGKTTAEMKNISTFSGWAIVENNDHYLSNGYPYLSWQVGNSSPVWYICNASAPTVTTMAPTGITTTGATSGGNITSGGWDSVTARGVCWSTSHNPTIADSHTTDGTGSGVFTSSITGLTPGTPYHVRAYATNSVGTAYGGQEDFTSLVQCHISSSANPAGGGPLIGDGTYDYGDTVSMVATANPGYHFVNWTESGTVVSTNAAYNFVATADRTLVANFGYRITMHTTDSGGTASGGGTFVAGTSVTVHGNPLYGTHFSAWWDPNIGHVSSSANYTFTATVDRDLYASFCYHIDANSNNPSWGDALGGEPEYGMPAIVHAMPRSGGHFVNWTEGGTVVSTSADYTFMPSSDRALVANFAINTYNITVTQGEHGNISPGNTTVNYGGGQVFSIEPAACYHIVDVLVNGSSVGAVSSYNFAHVTANHSIQANFAINTYTITVTQSEHGAISLGNTTVNCGNNQEFSISPDTGYRISDVLADDVSVGVVTSYNFTVVTGNHTITAVFVPKDSTQTRLASSANPSSYGQSVRFTATVTSLGSFTPTGTVTFMDGGSIIAENVPLTGGRASFTIDTLTAGRHNIYAVYSGDGNCNGSTSSTISQAVQKSRSSTSVSSSRNPLVSGTSVTFTVTVRSATGAGTPTGRVTIKDNFKGRNTIIGTVYLDKSGQATFTTDPLAKGLHSISAIYSGDSNLDSSVSSFLKQSVQ